MKKIITLLFLATQTITLAQTNENSTTNETEKVEESIKKNEIRINPGMLMFGMPEISYERILAKNHSIGLSFALSPKDETYQGIKYMITPQYRMYFGKKSARGLFMEASASVYQQTVYNYYPYYNSFTVGPTKQTNLGLGIAAGAKFFTENNWLGEISLGVGTGLLHRNQQYYYNTNDYYPRVSFAFGKRF